MATLIHPGAFVDPAAKLGVDVEIMPGAVVTRWAELGDRVIVHPGAVIGGDPQYLAFDRTVPSTVKVGEGTVLREGVTLNRSIHAGGATVVGARCFLMAGSHAGHDCVLDDDVVLANAVMLAGHVTVGSFSFIGGGAGIHQFCRIGMVVMVGGLAAITQDVPPFTMVAERNEVAGPNLVGLKRRGWSRETMKEIKQTFRAVMQPTGNPRVTAAALLPGAISPQVRLFLEFFAEGKRGFVRPTMRAGDGAGSEPTHE